MKVMFLSHELEINGATKAMIEIINALKDKVSFYVVIPSGEGPACNQIIKTGAVVIAKNYYRWVYFKRSEDDWKCWKDRWFSIHDDRNDEIAVELAEVVKREKIDIVHTNVSVLDIGARIKKYTGVRHIWHFRELSELSLKMYPLVGKEHFNETVNQYSDKCIFISKAVMDHYKGINYQKKVLIYDAVDEKNISNYKERHEGFNLLITGYVSESKGQMLAARACKELLAEGYTDIMLLVAGKINDTDKAVLSDILHEHVVICGYVDDLNYVWKKTDVALVCTNYEAFGRTTVESMMSEIPVIGSNSGGTPEIIPTEDAGGVLFNNGDYKDLKQKIQYLYDNPEKRRYIGECGRRRALSMFSMKRCAEEVYDCYVDVLKDS